MKKEKPLQTTQELSATAKGNTELYSKSVQMPRLLWKKMSTCAVLCVDCMFISNLSFPHVFLGKSLSLGWINAGGSFMIHF